jgi:hypothetical protein
MVEESPMVFVYECPTLLRTASGEEYVARVYADRQPDGRLWEAWFVFFPISGGPPLSTDRETTQSTFEDAQYWATGITPAYLEGALTRALERLPAARLLRHMARAEAEETYARAEAEAYAAAAEHARAKAREARDERRAAAEKLTGRKGRPRKRRGRAA